MSGVRCHNASAKDRATMRFVPALMLASFLMIGSHAFIIPAHYSYHSSSQNAELNRRDWFHSVALVAGISSASAPAFAAAATQARVEEWPPLEYLEPVYELKLSLDSLQSRVKDTSAWPLLQKRLEGFFKGGLLSEKFYYAGLSFQYISKIKYSKSDLT